MMPRVQLKDIQATGVAAASRVILEVPSRRRIVIFPAGADGVQAIFRVLPQA